jgi:hypothetical protein
MVRHAEHGYIIQRKEIIFCDPAFAFELAIGNPGIPVAQLGNQATKVRIWIRQDPQGLDYLALV